MPGGHSPELAVTLALAGGSALLLVGVALAAFVRRRSRSYLFVLLALGTLLVRTAVGTLTMSGVVAAGPHHVVEHALDVALVGFLLAAASAARTDRLGASAARTAASIPPEEER
jgi:hypothetical protein